MKKAACTECRTLQRAGCFCPRASTEKLPAARFELAPRTADAWLFHRRQRHGWVDEIPAAVHAHKRRKLLVPPFLPLFGKMRYKSHLRVVRFQIVRVPQHVDASRKKSYPICRINPLQICCTMCNRVSKHQTRHYGGFIMLCI